MEEEYRKQGIGKRIFAALQEKIEMKEVFETVREENKIMVPFLKKYGFENLGIGIKVKEETIELSAISLKLNKIIAEPGTARDQRAAWFFWNSVLLAKSQVIQNS